MAKNNNMWMFLIVGALAFVLIFGNPFATDDAVTPSDDTGAVPGIVCGSDTTPDLDINAYDIDNPGTAVTEATNIYRKVGQTAWTSFTQGTAITSLEVGEQYEVILGISASDFLDNAYGEAFITDPIECRELTVIDKGVYNDAAETTLTATFYNKNHDASSETFTAGQVKNVYLNWEAGSDTVFGNPFIADSDLGDNGAHSAMYPNVLCLNLNKTTWDKPDQVVFDGVELDSVGVPQRHSAATGETAYCYEFPVVDDIGEEVQVRMDADDSNAPAQDETASLYAGNFYIDSDGDLAWGVETDEGSAVGTDAADTLTLDFTA